MSDLLCCRVGTLATDKKSQHLPNLYKTNEIIDITK